jgi:mono/diheme cytochrome c family protein/uncharacterized membrane protein
MHGFRGLYRLHCVKCHGADGTGRGVRDSLPRIPDFTDASWQAGRSDAQLLASILDGKGTAMPPVRGKISEEQARGLIAYIKSFAPITGKSSQKRQEGPAQFGERYRRLQEHLDRLQEQFRKISEKSRSSAPTRLPESQQPQGTQPPVPAKGDIPRPVVPAPAQTSAVRELFAKHCVRCHGKEGTGSPARGRLPQIPDFTEASWQARRSDAQLLASILDGKGKGMPPGRGKITEEQARNLMAFVRAFARAEEKSPQEQQREFAPTFPGSGQEEPESPGLAEPGEVQTPRGFSEKLMGWLGRFHPPVVHFPIALLTAAAFAELLRTATGKPGYDAVTRYCVWLGALSGVVAGGLGWFLGGFVLNDASWVMLAHRWLGTSTVSCASLVLILSEISRRSDRYHILMWFRVMLFIVAALVLVTGFFGGAVVYGLDHYTWPQ